MLNNPKKSLAIFHLTSCLGCSETLTGSFSNLHNLYEAVDFGDGDKIDLEKKYDIAIVEGHPLTEKQIELAKSIRRHAGIVVAIGSCAHTGGVYLNKEKPLPKMIRVDYIVPGCPVDPAEISRCLSDLYWGKIFRLPDLAVCFECRQNENDCLIKKKKLCLGPVTRMGCNSICINNGEACLGCRGAKPSANLEKMTEVLKPISPEMEIEKNMTIFGKLK